MSIDPEIAKGFRDIARYRKESIHELPPMALAKFDQGIVNVRQQMKDMGVDLTNERDVQHVMVGISMFSYHYHQAMVQMEAALEDETEPVLVRLPDANDMMMTAIAIMMELHETAKEA